MLNSLPPLATRRTVRVYPDQSNLMESFQLAAVDVNANNVQDDSDHHLFVKHDDDTDQVLYKDLYKTLQKLGGSEQSVKAGSLAKALGATLRDPQPYNNFELLNVKCDMVRPADQEFRIQDDVILYTATYPEGFTIAQPLSPRPPKSLSENSFDYVRDLLMPVGEEMGWEVTSPRSF